MSDYILSCGSTVDLTGKHLADRDVSCVYFHYELDGQSYLDDLGKTIPLPEFYKAMEEGKDARTSQINQAEYTDYFDKLLSTGKDVLHIDFSSGLSGSVSSARLAAESLKEKYPSQKLYIVDSLAASSGYGLLVDKAADLRDGGMDIDSLRDWVEDNKLRVHHWFFSTTLKYYIKGGRVSKTAGFLGGILGICPLLHVDEEGHLIPMEKIRGKKKVIAATLDKMLKYCDNGTRYAEKCYISHSNSPEEAAVLKDEVEKAFPDIRGGVEIDDIGTVIGAHSGPGTVALFFWGKPRGKENA
ncbi:MAG: DegV family protein [Clostridia bacterium]|nr:DegV family protein [Clostridia bacterium]